MWHISLETGFWWGGLRERDHLEGLDVDESIILKGIFKKGNGEAGVVLVWLRIGTDGGLL